MPEALCLSPGLDSITTFYTLYLEIVYQAKNAVNVALCINPFVSVITKTKWSEDHGKWILWSDQWK